MTVASARSSPLRGWAAAAVTLAVVVASFTSSAPALAAAGQHAGMADPWILPVVLDGLAIIAAIAIHERRRDPIAWAVFIAAVAVSTWLQIGPASAGLVDVTVHAVPPLAGGVVLVELARDGFGWPAPPASPSPDSPLPVPGSAPAAQRRRRHLPVRLRAAIIERDGLVCGLCGRDVEREDVHIDHIHPVSLGGTDDPVNLQVTHSTCNLVKGARV